MFPLAKILLPVDFSERSLGAARYAEALGAHFASEICLLHVLEPMRYDLSTLEFGGTVVGELMATRAAQAREQLEGFLRDELQGVHVRRILLEGDPARRIIEFAHDEKVNLIALPTHGYGPFRRFILGSVTAKVLHDADCPVLTGVHMEEAPTAGSLAFRTILCAVDLGPQSRKALCWAAHMAADYRARLMLAHAVPCIARPGEQFDPALSDEVNRAARQEIESLRATLHAEAELCVEGGDPPQVVCRIAEQLKADLMVIGRGSAAGLFGRLRTNAYAIIRQSPCAVVSV